MTSRIGVRARMAAALVVCGLILYVDLRAAATLATALLYTPVATLFHRVPRAATSIGLGVVVTVFTAIGGWFETADNHFAVVTLNRTIALLVFYAVSFLIYRHAQAAAILDRLATTDPLTGVLNRRHYIELMTREQRRAERYGTTYSVLMVDIDRFKGVNDRFGHQIGDQAIRTVAQVGRTMLRPTDLMARYGGEEFIVTLTHTDMPGAITVAERLRQTVSDAAVPTPDGALNVTVSVGISTHRKPVPLDRIIGAADRALYQAKASGRNRVCAADNGNPM